MAPCHRRMWVPATGRRTGWQQRRWPRSSKYVWPAPELSRLKQQAQKESRFFAPSPSDRDGHHNKTSYCTWHMRFLSSSWLTAELFLRRLHAHGEGCQCARTEKQVWCQLPSARKGTPFATTSSLRASATATFLLRSRAATFRATLAPASQNILAATCSGGKARCCRMPAVAHAAR